MDWTGCDLVEKVQGRCSGAPTVAGTRIFPETFVVEHEAGRTVEQIHQDFPSVSAATIAGVLQFAKQKKVLSAA